MIHIQQPKVYRTQGRYIKRLIEPREVAALVVDDMSVVVGPSPYDRVEFDYQAIGG